MVYLLVRHGAMNIEPRELMGEECAPFDNYWDVPIRANPPSDIASFAPPATIDLVRKDAGVRVVIECRDEIFVREHII